MVKKPSSHSGNSVQSQSGSSAKVDSENTSVTPSVRPFNLEEADKNMKADSSSVNSSATSSVAQSNASSTAKSGVVRLKYEMCKNFREKGTCKYGDRCLFAHGDHELTKRGSQPETKPKEESKPAPQEPVKNPVEEPDEKTIADSTIDSTKIMEKSEIKAEEADLKKVEKGEKSQNGSELKKTDSNTSSKKEENEQDGSCGGESSDNLRSPDEEIQDHGEDSTTFSSIETCQAGATSTSAIPSENQNENQINEKSNENPENQYHENFENFKKDEEFKGLLENLDIENIEINLDAHTKYDQFHAEIIKNDEAIDEILKKQSCVEEDILKN